MRRKREARVESKRGTRWTADPRARVPGDESTEMRTREGREETHTMRSILRVNDQAVLERRQFKYIFESLLRDRNR